MLERVYIDNYRCFVNFGFRPGAQQLILGNNSSGKSAFLEAIRGLRYFGVAGHKADQVFPSETRTRWERRARQSFELEVKGGGGTYVYTLWIEGEDDQQSRVVKESLDFNEKPLLLVIDEQIHFFSDDHEKIAAYAFESDRSALTLVGSRKASRKLLWFKQWLENVYCIRIDPTHMRAEAKEEDDHPEDGLENFAAWYAHILQEQTGSFLELQTQLRQIIPGFDSLELKRIGRTSRLLRAAFSSASTDGDNTSKRQRIEFDFDELSDGQRALIALYTLLVCVVGRDRTVCLDEPENFLALAEIQPWVLALMDRIEESGGQAILISHHPELIDLLAPTQGVVFSRTEIGPVRVESYRSDAIGKLPPSEIVARGWMRA